MKSKIKVMVLIGFVDARANFRSYVPGDIVELPVWKAEALAAIGHVETVFVQEHPATRRQMKVTKPDETKVAPDEVTTVAD